MPSQLTTHVCYSRRGKALQNSYGHCPQSDTDHYKMFIPFVAKKMFHAQVAFPVTLTTALRSNTGSGIVEHAASFNFVLPCIIVQVK